MQFASESLVTGVVVADVLQLCCAYLRWCVASGTLFDAGPMCACHDLQATVAMLDTADVVLPQSVRLALAKRRNQGGSLMIRRGQKNVGKVADKS